MRPRILGLLICVGVGALILVSLSAQQVHAGSCPAVTVSNNHGIEGKYPGQFELAEFEQLASCTLSFSGNPDNGELNARIAGNPADLPPAAERVPSQPLVITPQEGIGKYGGVLNGLSNATEAGTSDLLSVRHVNLVRYAPDLQTVVPDIATGWQWNDDLTEITFTLRKGHRWSDGQPFTAEDVDFWFNDLILNKDIYEKTPSFWRFGDETAQVEAVDETTVKFTFPVPFPGIIARFAVSFIQPAQPKHFLSRFHIKYNPDANALAKERGLKDWVELIKVYYPGSDWKDVPTPLLKGADTQVVPTLESHIVVAESTKGRRLVANPFFHMIDTQGQQLPYINEIREDYVPDREVRNLKVTNGEVDYKGQNLFIEDFPLYKENETQGDYTVKLGKGVGELVFYSFNLTHVDAELRKIFNDFRFRQAMSLAIDRDEINDIVYFGQGTPQQAVPADPNTVAFVTDEQLNSFIEYDPNKAKALLDEMGLKDSDGDGVRERFDGKPLVLLLQFANQGAPVRMQELVQGYWADVGVRADPKEISTDQYRSTGRELDIQVWKYDQTSGAALAQDYKMMVPPFGDEWNPGPAFGWADWKNSGGSQGIEPPEDAKRLWDLAAEFNKHTLGTPESNRLGKEIVDIHAKNLWKIGTVGNLVTPYMYSNKLRNFVPIDVKTYDYYWAFPYRPYQWYFQG